MNIDPRIPIMTQEDRTTARIMQLEREVRELREALRSALTLIEQAPGAAPEAGRARLELVDNGSGKGRLQAVFPTGAAQIVAEEP